MPIAPHPSRAPRRSRRRIHLAVLVVVAALLAGACGSSGSDDSAGSGSGSGSGDAFPVTVEHKFGSTTVESEPQRVVSVGFSDQDPLLALGVVPVAIRDWFGDQPSATWPWAQEQLGGAEPVVLGSSDLSLEQIASLNPDLIVGVSSGMTPEQYELLSQIAPTIAQSDEFPDYQETWQNGTRLIGAAVGKSAEAEALISEVEADLAAARDANPEFEGTEGTISYVMDETQVGAYAGGDVRSRLLTDLGFVIPQEIEDLAAGDFYTAFSYEQMSRLDHDLLVWITYEPSIVEQLKAHPVRQLLTAAAEGREVFMTEMEAGAASFSSVLSIPYLLDTWVPKLAAAVDGDPSTAVG